MRIKGLVRVFNRVRSQLQTGLTPDEVEPFRQQVKAIVRDVEEICRQRRDRSTSTPQPPHSHPSDQLECAVAEARISNAMLIKIIA